MRLSVLERGCYGTQVELLQQMLNNTVQPRPPLALDGDFGPKTEREVRRLQSGKQLENDGEVGPRTWAVLGITPSVVPPLIAKAAPAVSQPVGRAGLSLISTHGRSSISVRAGTLPLVPAKHAVLRKRVQRRRVQLASSATPAVAGDAPWMKVASAEMGIHERTHDGTQRIIDYHSATSLHAHSDQVAWCSSFVNWCLKQVGITGTNNAAAASWAHWGKQLDQPRYGAVIQLHHATRGHDGRTGSSSGNHVAFFLRGDSSHVELLGGNQSDSVKISRFSLATYHMAAVRWPK